MTKLGTLSLPAVRACLRCNQSFLLLPTHCSWSRSQRHPEGFADAANRGDLLRQPLFQYLRVCWRVLSPESQRGAGSRLLVGPPLLVAEERCLWQERYPPSTHLSHFMRPEHCPVLITTGVTAAQWMSVISHIGALINASAHQRLLKWLCPAEAQ